MYAKNIHFVHTHASLSVVLQSVALRAKKHAPKWAIWRRMFCCFCVCRRRPFYCRLYSFHLSLLTKPLLHFHSNIAVFISSFCLFLYCSWSRYLWQEQAGVATTISLSISTQQTAIGGRCLVKIKRTFSAINLSRSYTYSLYDDGYFSTNGMSLNMTKKSFLLSAVGGSSLLPSAALRPSKFIPVTKIVFILWKDTIVIDYW